MKNLNLLGLAFVLIVSALSCKKDSPALPPTALQITLVDNTGSPVIGATVKLYQTLHGMEIDSAMVSIASFSDVSGKVTFTNLLPIKYYWFASNGCQNNFNGTKGTTTELTPNATTSVTSILAGTGSLIIVNNSLNQYQIYINNVFAFTANGGLMYTYKNYPAISYTVKAVQVNNTSHIFNFTPTTLTCGGSITCTIPN